MLDTDITEYVWDHRNRLKKVAHYTTHANYSVGTADKIVEYAYDHQNRLVSCQRCTLGGRLADKGHLV